MTCLLHMICMQHLQHILLKALRLQSINEINQSVSQPKVKKLNHFSAFHNFRYEEAVSGYGKRIVSVKERNLNMRISTLLTWMRKILLIKSLLSKIHQDCLYQLEKKQLCRKVDYFTVLKRSAITAALCLTT